MNATMKKAIEQYEVDGYAKLKVFNEEEFKFIEGFTKHWVGDVIFTGSSNNPEVKKMLLQDYHKWWKPMGVEHDGLFRAQNRYINPEGKLKSLLLNPTILEFLSIVHKGKLIQWADPGLGWLGYRFIRPGMGDGYPTSCKNWGAAAGVISVWLPIIGFTSKETIALVPGSHKKQYKNYLPETKKFTAGELRLAETIDANEYLRPELLPGEVIFFHPATLHTEDVVESPISRLNLEYRFKPVN